ncbi:MAG: hypothetical protein AUG03_05400 [Acidobacteria bacterium 13_1_20CM_2_68_14]|nr:MAG: hypothetical protein AUG03_05400 [Acidobacteria bacterium 13_1_20CM_2_68_14]
MRERFALAALEYPIPARSNRLDFMLGALTLVALTLLGVTGIVLTQFYDPAPLGAHESVRYVITSLPLVSLVRDIHVWSATGAVVLVFTHLAAVFWPWLPETPGGIVVERRAPVGAALGSGAHGNAAQG